MHKTVLLKETIEALDLRPGLCVFEGTGGEGGLSREIAGEIAPGGTLVITELDRESRSIIQSNLDGSEISVIIVAENFKNIERILADNAKSQVDRIVLDLGLSSRELEESGRGFSFERDEPLVMTFKSEPDENDLTAKYVVNNWSEESLSDIIWGYGGEDRARQIARAIVTARANKEIETSLELAQIVETAVGGRRGALHPATKTFQALRIAVNDELGALRQVLSDGWKVLSSGGRFVVIAFHELEDREVKKFFRNKQHSGEGELLTKKPVTPSEEEEKANPRSRSAKLRVIKKNHAKQ